MPKSSDNVYIPYLLIEPYKSLRIHPHAASHKYTHKQSTQTVATSDDVSPHSKLCKEFLAVLYNNALSSLYTCCTCIGNGFVSRTWRVPAAQRPPASNKLNYFYNSHLFIRPKRKCKKNIRKKYHIPSLYLKKTPRNHDNDNYWRKSIAVKKGRGFTVFFFILQLLCVLSDTILMYRFIAFTGCKWVIEKLE